MIIEEYEVIAILLLYILLSSLRQEYLQAQCIMECRKRIN